MHAFISGNMQKKVWYHQGPEELLNVRVWTARYSLARCVRSELHALWCPHVPCHSRGQCVLLLICCIVDGADHNGWMASGYVRPIIHGRARERLKTARITLAQGDNTKINRQLLHQKLQARTSRHVHLVHFVF